MANRDGFANALDRLDQRMDGNGRVAAEFEAELARLRQSMILTGREVGTLSHGIERGLRRAFDGLVLDGARLSDALKDIGQSIANTVYSIVMRPVGKAVAGQLAGGLNDMLSGALPFAQGGAFVQGRVMPFAKGGIVSEPTHFPMRGATGLMGEAGPEAIMPLKRGADGRLGVATQGASARPVNVTINVSTPDLAGFQRSQSQIAAQLGRVLSRGERNA